MLFSNHIFQCPHCGHCWPGAVPRARSFPRAWLEPECPQCGLRPGDPVPAAALTLSQAIFDALAAIAWENPYVDTIKEAASLVPCYYQTARRSLEEATGMRPGTAWAALRRGKPYFEQWLAGLSSP